MVTTHGAKCPACGVTIKTPGRRTLEAGDVCPDCNFEIGSGNPKKYDVKKGREMAQIIAFFRDDDWAESWPDESDPDLVDV